MDGTCYKKNKERGIWFQIQCVKDIVERKEANGEDASFERELLEAWSKHKGWEDARMEKEYGTKN